LSTVPPRLMTITGVARPMALVKPRRAMKLR
jgi:hypothetical protein